MAMMIALMEKMKNTVVNKLTTKTLKQNIFPAKDNTICHFVYYFLDTRRRSISFSDLIAKYNLDDANRLLKIVYCNKTTMFHCHRKKLTNIVTN